MNTMRNITIDVELASSIKRISENEGIVTELEILNKLLSNEMNQCEKIVISKEDSAKFAIDRGSLIASVLAKYLKYKE